jgi:hypothetical protein
MKDQKFALVMSAEEKTALHDLAYRERVSAAELVRRLIWIAAQKAPSTVHPISDNRP